MIAVWAVLVMMFGHWLFDFVLQPDWMGKGKSRSWGILSEHSVRITVGAFAVAVLVASVQGFQRATGWLLLFAAINGVAHFGIDAVTSRLTGRLYAQGDHHNFFVVIGFDQFLHMVVAVTTLAWLVT
jgi:hypothetical protein